MGKPDLAGEDYLRSTIHAFPSPVLIVDKSLIILDANQASKDVFGDDIGHMQISLNIHICDSPIASVPKMPKSNMPFSREKDNMAQGG